MVGHLVYAVIRHIADRNAALAGGFEIDVVDSNPIPDNHFGLLHGRNHAGIHWGKLGDHGIRVSHQSNQGFRGFALTTDEFEAEWLKDGFFDLKRRECVVCDDNFGHGRPRDLVRAGFCRWELVKKQSNKWLGGGKQIVLFSFKICWISFWKWISPPHDFSYHLQKVLP